MPCGAGGGAAGGEHARPDAVAHDRDATAHADQRRDPAPRRLLRALYHGGASS